MSSPAPTLNPTFTPSAISHATVLETLAHELSQPLGAIEATAYYLDLVLDRDENRAREHTSRLHGLVEQSSWMISCALELVNQRPLNRVPADLEELITSVLAGRAIPGLPAPELELAGDLPLAFVDPGRVRILIENSLSLFERVATDRDRVRLRTTFNINGKGEDLLAMELEVGAAGYQSESSLGAGSVLGLQSFRRTIELHGGTLHFAVDPVTGLRARLLLPASVVLAAAAS